MVSGTLSPAVPGFMHSALIADSDQRVRQVLVPAMRRALIEADGVFAVVSARTARILREGLGKAADQLGWDDSGVFHRPLGFAHESFRRLLAAAHAGGRRLHVFTEPAVASVDEAGAVDRAAAYLPYEAICNETFAGYGCQVTCLWDARQHPASFIENVRSLHNHELGPAGWERNSGFVGPGQYLARLSQLPLLLPAHVGWQTTLTGLGALPMLRGGLQDWVGQQSFTPAAASDVVLAVHEIATNGLTHGQPPVRVSGWRQQDIVVVQVDDEGGTPLPALAGYQPPGGQANEHRGLWLIRQLADVVETHTTDSSTSVRLYFPRRLTHGNPSSAGGLARWVHGSEAASPNRTRGHDGGQRR